MPLRLAAPIALGVVLLLLPGCSSTSLKFDAQGQQPFSVVGTDVQVRIQITGINDDGEQPELRARFLVAGSDADFLVIDPSATTLATGDLHDLGSARLVPDESASASTVSGRRSFEIAFALPPQELDLTALYMDWTLIDSAGIPFAGPPARFRGVVVKSGGWFKPHAGVGIGPNGPVWNGGIGL